jgi:hypothetical protein
VTESKKRKPFPKRLLSSIIIWLIIAFVLGTIGFFIWLLPQRGEFELRGEKLPPLSELTLVEGKITFLGYYTSRSTQLVRPTIEFQVAGEKHQFKTIDSYSMRIFPFETNQKVEVLILSNDPAKAWLKWEYERLIENYESFGILRLGEVIKGSYFYVFSAILSLSGLILLINLFVPMLRIFVRDK